MGVSTFLIGAVIALLTISYGFNKAMLVGFAMICLLFIIGSISMPTYFDLIVIPMISAISSSFISLGFLAYSLRERLGWSTFIKA